MIKELDYDVIPNYASIVLAGKRRSGKGVLTKDLVKKVISKKKTTKRVFILTNCKYRTKLYGLCP